MNVDTLAQLAELDLAETMAIVTVNELPEFDTIGGKRWWTNRFVATDSPGSVDGVLCVQSRAGQFWYRIRDVP